MIREQMKKRFIRDDLLLVSCFWSDETHQSKGQVGCLYIHAGDVQFLGIRFEVNEKKALIPFDGLEVRLSLSQFV